MLYLTYCLSKLCKLFHLHLNVLLFYTGPLGVAIPGELKGYQEAHERFGKLPWKDLFEPTIRLCEEGVPISKRFEEMLSEFESELRSQPTFM